MKVKDIAFEPALNYPEFRVSEQYNVIFDTKIGLSGDSDLQSKSDAPCSVSEEVYF